MHSHLLVEARRFADQSAMSIRVAALLRISRAASTTNAVEALETLRTAIETIGALPVDSRDLLFEEAREVAAVIDPGLLSSIPGQPSRFDLSNILRVMLEFGHTASACQLLLQQTDSSLLPYDVMREVLSSIDALRPELTETRSRVLRHAIALWRNRATDGELQELQDFTWFFGKVWNELPSPEAKEIAGEIVFQAIRTDDSPIAAMYCGEVLFDSQRQNTLFQVLHVLRKLDLALAESCIFSHNQLAIAARRFPNGLQSIEAEQEQEQAANPLLPSTQAYFLMGDPDDIERQRMLVEAYRPQDFRLPIANAIALHHQETSPETYNLAPKAFWFSTGDLRQVFYQVGKRLGIKSATLLNDIIDDDLRLFASIELAAAIAGVPDPRVKKIRRVLECKPLNPVDLEAES